MNSYCACARCHIGQWHLDIGAAASVGLRAPSGPGAHGFETSGRSRCLDSRASHLLKRIAPVSETMIMIELGGIVRVACVKKMQLRYATHSVPVGLCHLGAVAG